MSNREGGASTALQLAQSVREGRITAARLVEDAFATADAVGAGHDGLFTTLWEDRAWSRAEAQAMDQRPDRRSRQMAGVPVMSQDNLATLHLPTTCGSRILEGYVSAFEAAIRRAPAGQRRYPDRQDQYGRVCDGLVH
ncbi:MAG: amidase family protein [Gemmatimonadaceae bacterium]